MKSGELSLSEIISRVTKAYIEFGATPTPASITDGATDESEVAVETSASSTSVAAVASPPTKDYLEEEEEEQEEEGEEE